MEATVSAPPRVWSFKAALRHLSPQSVIIFSRGYRSSRPHHDPWLYNTRICFPQLPDPSMFGPYEYPRCLATSNSSSITESSSLQALQNTEVVLRHSTLERTSSSSSSLEYPPPAVCPPETEKDIKSAHQCLVESTQHERSSSGGEVTQSRSRRFYLHWFTAYRILIALTFLINVLILVILIGLHRSTGGALTATAVNLFTSVLIRQEDLVNLSFGFISRIPSSLPLSLRKLIADFHHYGGVHIGAALSASIWYVIFVAIGTQEFLHKHKDGDTTAWHWADIATSYAFLLTLLAICITSVPRLRLKIHNAFEATHRFGGWLALLVLWLNTGIHTHTTPTAPPLHKSPAFWLLAATTVLIILPWLRIHRIPITSTPLSTKEIKLSFPYTNMPHTSTMRFSSSPLTEWHAFATIPTDSPNTASIVVSAAGDWTRNTVAHPPTTLYIRAPAVRNFLSFAPLFKSVLLVATGAGIAPLLSLLASPAMAAMRAQGRAVKVLWCAYDPWAAHWGFVMDAISRVDPRPVVKDSKTGRLDVAWEARYLAGIEGVEAVFVVSNRRVTDEVVGCVKGDGRAAFGAVFDS